MATGTTKMRTSTFRDLARCERSRVSRRGALATLAGGLAIAGLAAQLLEERELLYQQQRHRRPFAAIRHRSMPRTGPSAGQPGEDPAPTKVL